MIHYGTTSTSALDTLKTCPKKYQYRYVRGLTPKQTPSAMAVGTLFHQAAAAGYEHERMRIIDTHFDGTEHSGWLYAALEAAQRTEPVDRDGHPLGLTDESVEATCDMLSYYYEHVGRHDRFDEILAVEEEIFFERAGWTVRATMDLVVREGREVVVYDHKTSGDINGDMAHLPLDLQTHIYYLAARERWGRPAMFVHNFVSRFDFASKQRSGPPNFTRADGTKPYLLTESGRKATRSDDPNDYVRRVRTPLSDRQLDAFDHELTARLRTLSFHTAANVWPRSDTKMGFGCSSCPYYSVCTTELDGREIAPQMLAMLFDEEPPK